MTESARARGDAEAALNAFCGLDKGRSAAIASVQLGAEPVAIRGTLARPAASVLKVALVMALYDSAAQGQANLDEPLAISGLDSTRYASILAAFDADRTLSLREIAALALIVSDNPATSAVLDRVGFDAVNAVLAAAGCSVDAQMRVGFREAELGPANRANKLSACDGLRLFARLHSAERYAPIVHVLQNNLRNNRIPALLPDDVVVAHKTGSLEGVVNNVGVMSLGVRSVAVSVLCDRQPDPIGTSREIAELSLRLARQFLGV